MARRKLTEEQASAQLRARARLAAQREEVIELGEPHALFRRGGQLYGVALPQMRFSWNSDSLVEVPGGPRWVSGMASREGQLVTVIDLAHFYDLPLTGVADVRSILVVEAEGRLLGLAGERALGVHEVKVASIRAAPEPRGALVRGAPVAGETALLLDVTALLTDPRLNPLVGGAA